MLIKKIFLKKIILLKIFMGDKPVHIQMNLFMMI